MRSIAIVVLASASLSGAVRVGTYVSQVPSKYTTRDGLPSDDVTRIVIRDGEVIAVTTAGAAKLSGGRWTPVTAPEPTPAKPTYDIHGRLWTTSPQGILRFDGGKSKLYTGADGLPFNDFTCSAAGGDGSVWFGTRRGAIRFDGATWEYRQGLRWLPHDEIRGIAVDGDGNAWFATAKGVGLIARRPATLDEKAKFFEAEIDKRHRRTEYGYVESVLLTRPGDASEFRQRDSDNDGLWTSMYGAGECFAYGARRDPKAKKRATAAFEALRFLGQVTQGGNHPAPKGFVARTILPASGPDPNRTHTPERDRRSRETRDKLWKVIVPRWPKSADGKWYWKSDTSSDELDGHYFFYANYYDLVAESDEEKRRVREHVAALTDHLVEHGFELIDHDGKPTRWGIFSPAKLNYDPNWWEERGLNSLSILAYLRTAEHITGNAKYGDAARTLIEKHAYATNVLIPKSNAGPGSGNQSDDEMAFMNFYCLLKYERDPKLREMFAFAFYQRWIMERYELNPLFNFMYAASATGLKFTDASGSQDLSPAGAWLEESIDTLKRYPLDRLNWGLANSHRLDVVPLPEHARGGSGRGSRRDGRVLPIDERFVDKWNHDPWRLDYGGDGRVLADGASFLLPYYMGLYHGFIE